MAGIASLAKGLKQAEDNISELRGIINGQPTTWNKALDTRLNEIQAKFEGSIKQSINKFPTTEDLQALEDALKKLRDLVISIGQHTGGGNANRNIQIGGVNFLSPFTDLNIKAGANVTLTYSSNQITKYTDLTISATGGSGSGIVRSVSTVAVDTTAGAAFTTDYVYLVSGNVTITLPTSVGNSNLYTVKNIGAGVVTIATTGGETIDGAVNLVMPVQFTSVDLISNNSGNWDIT